jgi:two-component SAPR family response regulator
VHYQLDASRVRPDTDELDRLLAHAAKIEAPAERQQALEDALALFYGEPLDGADYPWAEAHLRRLHACLAELLEAVARARLEAEDPRRALEAAERALTIDPLNEAFCRLAMQAESVLGLRDAIRQRYEHLRKLLDKRLGLEPEKETRALYRRLLSQE